MKKLLIKLAYWILRHYKIVLPNEPTTKVNYDLVALSDREHEALDRAMKICFDLEEQIGDKQSGEFKRHQAYAKLIKEFPDVSKRKLALVIELGLN